MYNSNVFVFKILSYFLFDRKKRKMKKYNMLD